MRSIGGGGAGLVGLLVTILLMGALGAVVLDHVGGTVTSTTVAGETTTTNPSTNTTLPGSNHLLASAANKAACVTDGNSINSAIGTYTAVEPSPLPVETGITIGKPASYPNGTAARTLLASGYLASWPDSPAFSFALSTSIPDLLMVYVPADNTTGVPFLGEGATSGCNAL